MNVLRNIIIIISLLGVFVFGYFLIVRLDKFLDENRKAIKKENEKEKPYCVMLTEELSEDEILDEVRRFKNQHKGTRIVLYDSSDAELNEKSMEYHTDRKQ